MTGRAAPTSPLGSALQRVEAREKVTGAARYAYEHPREDVLYGWIVGATIARGEIRAIDAGPALAASGVIAILTHESAPALRRVADHELMVLQSPAVAYRGQIVAAVVAETAEAAREGAALVRIAYAENDHDVLLRPDHPKLYKPDVVNPSFPTDTALGDFEAAFGDAPVQIDATYVTAATHNNPMEPHATMAVWEDGGVTLYDSTQGAPAARDTIAQVLGLERSQVRVISPHVGGGFGSKGSPRPHAVLAALCAKVAGRPVKLAVTRQQMFDITGYRTPTIQRLRLGADREGRLSAIAHDVVEQTSTVREFAEQTATATRVMYAAPNRRTSHRLAALDVPTPAWMRAPGECPGMFALESAIDELAVAAGVDPIELRVRNEPPSEPETGKPFSSRSLVRCLEEGAARFGWASRDPAPGVRREGRWLVGTGVAASIYPAYQRPSEAFARARSNGRFEVGVGAADIGTGARTVLTQIAADALGVDLDAVDLRIGDSALPPGPVAGGSAGTASWGSAVAGACRALSLALEEGAEGEVEASYDTGPDLEARGDYARYAFGAQFAEVRVDVDSGEVRLARMLGVFAAGRILNPLTARSQLIGGMTMGFSMALLEESRMDPGFGDFLNHDLAQYHVPVNADVRDIDATWLDEHDEHLNPMGSKGIGEIGIVGAAAAVANAVYHATGTRFRELPIRPDRVLATLGDPL
ncbi:MAG TPA: xanthine dehydrogenase family protein molybdopterin-binding subunit [Solirubrobacteraceae bacterium]|nr:xanthine dehydrogenase family protein molybdopterin-binding subunit [Solirubrobacteraceae bacterium]